MSNISKAFANGTAFIGFVTGGDPTLAASEEFILQMAAAGADIIEIGIPFSDPIAEGPVIQAANLRALGAGATVESMFALVANVRKKIATPLVFLTYLNPVLHYGYEAFFAHCEAVELDGIIIPDLPFEEQGELRDITRAHGVDLISLVAPTSAQRVAQIAAQAQGFLYIVSSMGVTGVRSKIATDLAEIVRNIRAATALPAAVGFGLHSTAQAREIAQFADGVIVGSAIVKICEQHGAAAGPHLYTYVKEMKTACSFS
ncbi:MAG: tryptophan synthase subunit alpha [Oscillospiraceae bacterium]|jgi:tryptophan synthase alpha chain|nr:tryptophan synthase subunit alpha [Oscillospiraceae bacterium]